MIFFLLFRANVRIGTVLAWGRILETTWPSCHICGSVDVTRGSESCRMQGTRRWMLSDPRPAPSLCHVAPEVWSGGGAGPWDLRGDFVCTLARSRRAGREGSGEELDEVLNC